MVVNHLLRELAPLSADAWDEVDREARSRLTTYLAARKLIDFGGPHGWRLSSTSTGRTAIVGAAPADGVLARQRRVVSAVELRATFTVSRAELADIDRGAVDVDLESLDEAARQIALAENVAVFHGFAEAGIVGIAQASSYAAAPLGEAFVDYPASVAAAVNMLRLAGVEGPFGLALSPAGYTGVVETTEFGGHVVLHHLNEILGGPIVWAPGIEGAVVVSLRGGDFLFESGQDLSVGYLDHDATSVTLYIEESFTFRVADGDAAIALKTGTTTAP